MLIKWSENIILDGYLAHRIIGIDENGAFCGGVTKERGIVYT